MKRTKKILVFGLSLLILPYAFWVRAGFAAAEAGEAARYAYVLRVIDGDTVKLNGGEKVRYLGIDAPERGEPFYRKAKKRNTALVEGRLVKLVVCGPEPKDRYGRTLAWVYVDGQSVNETLLREGLAKALIIPPCAAGKEAELRRIEAEAIKDRAGVWGIDRPHAAYKKRIISPQEAPGHVGESVRVKGRVTDIRKGKNAVFINFDSRGRKKGFTAVIFKKSLAEFEASGIDIYSYKGRVIAVEGVVRSYDGRTEIIIKLPSQLDLNPR